MTEKAQSIALPFSRGLDTKTDAKLVAPPFLTVLENGVFQSGNTISKRNGFRVLGNNTTTGTPITTGVASFAHNNELLICDDVNAYSYGQTDNEWINKGPAVSVGVSATDVIRNAYQQTMPDCAVANNIALYAWLDSRGGVRASVIDMASGVYYQTDVLLNASVTTAPRCITVGGSLLAVYTEPLGTIRMSRVNASGPAAFDILDQQITNAGATTHQAFDCIPTPADSNSFLLFYANAVGTMTLCFVTRGGFVGNPILGYHLPVIISAGTAAFVDCCAIITDSAFLYLAWHNAADGVSTACYSTSIAFLLWGAVTIADSVPWVNLTGVNNTTSTGAGTIAWCYEFSSGFRNAIFMQTSTTGAIVVSPTRFKPGLGFASKPFIYNGITYVGMTYGSTLQSTYFVCSIGALVAGVISGNFVSKHLEGVGGGYTASTGLPQMVSLGNGKYIWAGLQKGVLNSQNGNVFTLTGVTQLTINFQQTNRFSAAKMGEQTHVTGGLVGSYDSNQLVEHGFTLFPEVLTLSSTPTTGGHMSNGIYVYQAVYEWQDNRGQLHRSSPSSPLIVSLTGSTATQEVVIDVPTLIPTSKTGIVVALYRTQSNGTIFYKVSSVLAPTINITTDILVIMTDTLADATIAGNEILYTVGGELPNDPPPTATLICASKSRIFLAGTEDRDLLWYSKEQVYGDGVSFSGDLTKRINPTGGGITAIAYMDDKIIVFKKSMILYFSGEGPNALGQSDTFTDVEVIASDVGCTNSASIVLTSEGLFFSSSKGIYMLSRSLQVSYVGAPVEAYNNQTITSAVLVDTYNQIRWTCSNGNALVYNYFFEQQFADIQELGSEGQWGVFTNYSATSATAWQGGYVFLRANGSVCAETPGVFTDGGYAIVLKIVTAWIKLPTIGGSSRVKEMLAIGNYRSPHQLLVGAAYDFQPYAPVQLLFDTKASITNLLSTWGGDASWGAYPTWGGSADSTYQFRNRIPTQQCEAVQLSFQDSFPPGYAPGEGYSINSLTLLVDPQTGLARLSPARTL